MYEYTLKSIWRKPARSILLCVILVLIFFGELAGIYLYSLAKQGEQDAFQYNGAAINVYGEELNMTKETYDKMFDIPGVFGINQWKEARGESAQLTIVKDHEGMTPDVAQTSDDWNENSFPMIALMDVSLFSWFYHKNGVSLTAGTFPTEENGGVLIERRLAQQNNLSIGDTIDFNVSTADFNQECSLPICGIFTADTDFIVTEDNTVGEKVYQYSPYNKIFIHYTTLANIGDFAPYSPNSCQVYVDKLENVEEVAASIGVLLGDSAQISDNTSSMVKTGGPVAIMKRFSLLILGGVLILGNVVLLILFALYGRQYRYESGIYLALGCDKRQVILQYFLSMLFLIFISLFLGGILFLLLSKTIMSQAGHMVAEANSFQLNSMIRPYYYSNLGVGFKLNTNVSGVVGISGPLGILAIAIFFLLVAMLIPIYSVLKTKTKELLRAN